MINNAPTGSTGAVNEIGWMTEMKITRGGTENKILFISETIITYMSKLCLKHRRKQIYVLGINTAFRIFFLYINLSTFTANTLWSSFKTNAEVRHGCILSPIQFNTYTENMMRRVMEE